jgi:hypothetical protein
MRLSGNPEAKPPLKLKAAAGKAELFRKSSGGAALNLGFGISDFDWKATTPAFGHPS